MTHDNTITMPPISMFAKVRNMTEAACNLAVTARLDCCANLADLHCTDVVYCMRDDGDCWWRVSVEEAFPDDYKLKQFIIDYMMQNGVAVDVMTEW